MKMRFPTCVICLLIGTSALAAEGPELIADWSFDDSIPGTVHGTATAKAGGLESPGYPDFAEGNKSLTLAAPSWLSLPSEQKFQFDNGDRITLEAWVRVDSAGENAYIVGKGRTGTSGVDTINQNWALRLRQNKGQMCVNFLFHSRDTDEAKGDWHRWTSNQGISRGSRWHHVAVTYHFGHPESIRGYVDGRAVKGSWDMGGATTQPPMIDDAEVWVGSAMGGNKGNSLAGAVDNVRIYRGEVDSETLLSRFNWIPPELKPPVIPKGKVVVQLYGPVDSISEISTEATGPLTTWQQDEMAFVRLPHKYDDWGIREDWGKTMIVRAWTDIQLPAGDYRFLVRSRGMCNLVVDGNVLTSTPPQPNRSGAHHVVDDLPEVPVPGMRPHWMSDSERIVDYLSDGKSHRVLCEMIVGGPRYRLEFGEACVAVAEGSGMFHLLSSRSQIPLTDEGWLAFVERQSVLMDQLDRTRRVAQNSQLADFWTARHDYARANLVAGASEQTIDSIIDRHIANVNAQAAQQTVAEGDAALFEQQVQPIFDAHCNRCHGQKEQGGLLISNRDRLLEGGESGSAAVVPGKPEESYLFQLISAPADDYRMPPKGDGLTAKEVEVVRQWILSGASMPQPTAHSIQVPELVSDEVFLRRVSLDTVGVPPTSEELQAFLGDKSPDRRAHAVDRLLNDDRWADNWVGYWQDVFAENPNLLKPTLNNTGPFRWWIHEALTDNKPLDRFATELMLMRGSTWGGGTAGFSVASQNDVPMAAKAHVIGSAFLGVNMKCARCHDAPYHDWKQQDLFQMAAMLQRNDLKLPESSTVPAAFFEKQARKSLIEVTLRPGTTVPAHFPFDQLAPEVNDQLLTNSNDTRERLAAQVTASRRFAEVMANRLWKRLMGHALVEPVDDWEGNPPSNPELLAHLADVLIQVDYDVREFARTVMNSNVYQRQAVDLPAGRAPDFEAPYRRRMTAEQIVDSALHVTGNGMKTEPLTMDIEGTLPAETFLHFGQPTRAWEFTTLANERDRPSLALPRAQAIADMLAAFGWRDSRPEPETEREERPNLVQPGVMANGTLSIWLTRLTDEGGITQDLLQPVTVEEMVEGLFQRILTRSPSAEERRRFVEVLKPGFEDRRVPSGEIGTAPEEERFRYVSWSNHLNSEANVIKVQIQELVRQGPPPTRYLRPEWRERAEDAVWSLLNSPEMILIP
ncbi:MAG: DUF1553 domain-containing protein [Planctomycetaceae bacterium]|nr:DUF1553 domain-containing protein [Planctomycetaceae bacterium]